MAPPDEEIWGFHAIDEALRAGERIQRICVPKVRERDERVAQLIARARAQKIPVVLEPPQPSGRQRWSRNGSSDRRSEIHALLPAFAYAPFRDIRTLAKEANSTLVVAVDHLEDPQNLGAVLRNAEGAGASAIVMPDRRNADVTAVTRRASAGATSHLKIARVPNIVAALDALKADGCWVTGLTLAANARDYDRVDYAAKSVLVVGAEGKGLSRLVSEHCDILVRIPLYGQVASLNAASAAAVVLFEVARRHRRS